MKKKLSALLLTALLLLALLPQSMLAAPTAVFTSVNDMLLDLTSATMPFYSDGELYVPSAVFEAKSGRLPELGVFFNHDRRSELALLYRGGEVLVFDLKEDIAYDSSSHRAVEGAALVHSDSVFFPMETVAEFFSLDYSYTKVTYGHLLRVKNSAVMLSDAEFIAAAENPMRQRYNQYVRAQESANNAAGSETQPVGPAGTGITVSPLLRVSGVESAGKALSVFERYNTCGTLIFDVENMAGMDDLLRRAAGSGHAVVLAADGSLPTEEILAGLSAGNELLCRAAVCRTRLVYIENAPQALRDTLRGLGYELISPLDLSGVRSGRQVANRILSAADARRGHVSAYLGTDTEMEAYLGNCLSYLRSEECTLAALREWP